MNTLVVWLLFLMAAGSSVGEFTDFEDGTLWYYTEKFLPFEKS